MAEELPKRLFKEGEETQVTQINNNCRIDYILKKFEAWLPRELDVLKKDPTFYQIFKLQENGLGYSARMIHSMLCRQLMTYKRWTPTRVAFMPSIFCLQMDTEFNKFVPNKKAYELHDFLISYGRGELPAHGRTDQVWGVDVDRLYFPQFINGNHWIAVCINIIERKVEVFDCNRGRNRQYVEKFAALIPRIVKAVAPPESKKQLLVSPYSIVEVPMKARLNKSCADCGAYALKHLECHVLGLDLSLVDDEIIQGCRQKITVDLWEASHDPILAQVMTQYVPSPWDKPGVFDLSEDE